MNVKSLIYRPIITEKSLQMAENQRYTFLVAKKANKHQIAQAIKELFGVDVLEVKTLKIGGKSRRFGKSRQTKKMADSKRAIVKIKSDQKIDLFEVKEQQ